MGRACVRVCARVHVRVCVRACVCNVVVRVCVRVRVRVREWGSRCVCVRVYLKRTRTRRISRCFVLQQ